MALSSKRDTVNELRQAIADALAAERNISLLPNNKHFSLNSDWKVKAGLNDSDIALKDSLSLICRLANHGRERDKLLTRLEGNLRRFYENRSQPELLLIAENRELSAKLRATRFQLGLAIEAANNKRSDFVGERGQPTDNEEGSTKVDELTARDMLDVSPFLDHPKKNALPKILHLVKGEIDKESSVNTFKENIYIQNLLEEKNAQLNQLKGALDLREKDCQTHIATIEEFRGKLAYFEEQLKVSNEKREKAIRESKEEIEKSKKLMRENEIKQRKAIAEIRNSLSDKNKKIEELEHEVEESAAALRSAMEALNSKYKGESKEIIDSNVEKLEERSQEDSNSESRQRLREELDSAHEKISEMEEERDQMIRIIEFFYNNTDPNLLESFKEEIEREAREAGFDPDSRHDRIEETTHLDSSDKPINRLSFRKNSRHDRSHG